MTFDLNASLDPIQLESDIWEMDSSRISPIAILIKSD